MVADFLQRKRQGGRRVFFKKNPNAEHHINAMSVHHFTFGLNNCMNSSNSQQSTAIAPIGPVSVSRAYRN